MATKLIYSDSVGSEIEVSSTGGSGSGSEPSQYVRDVTLSGRTLTFTKNTGATLNFTDTDTVYDDTALAARVTAAETSLASKMSKVSGSHTDEIVTLDSGGNAVASGYAIALLDQLRADVDAINVDNMGDAHAKSIDLDEIPKICGFPLILFGTAAPSVTPDFIGQMYIDKTNVKVYVATGVENASSFSVLN